jgi:hypothetical protein
MIGHDIHLQKLPSGFEQARPLGAPTPIPLARVPCAPERPAAVVAPMVEAITDSIPIRRYRPQQSRLARFLGRWSTDGHFHPRSSAGQRTLLDDVDDEALEVPRDRTGRNILLVLVIAVFTFLVTVAMVKIRQRYVTALPASSAQVVENQTQAPPLPVPPTLTALPAPIAPHPAPPAIPAPPEPAEKPVLLGTPAATPAPTNSPRPHKPARTAVPPGQLPEHLKGELLPLSP